MSKLSLHLQHVPSWFGAFVAACAGRLGYVKGVDVFPDLPGVKTIGRTYLKDSESDALVMQGAAGADAWIARFLPAYRDKAHVWAWEGPNEFLLTTQARVNAFNAFHIRFISRMAGMGYRTVCGNINVGWPHLAYYNDPEPRAAAIGPMVQALANHGHILSFHEYCAPRLSSPGGVPSLVLRYGLTLDELRDAGVTLPKVMITELGIDEAAVKAVPHAGWQKFLNASSYMQELDWYDGKIGNDPDVLAAFIFTAVPSGWGWDSFDVTQELALMLAQQIANDGPEPPDPPEGGKIVQVVDFQGNVTTWDWLVATFGPYVQVTAGATTGKRWRVKQLRARDGYAALVAVTEAQPGTKVARHWPDASELPSTVQPQNYRRGVWDVTKSDATIGFPMGTGDYYWPNDPASRGVSALWVAEGVPSDTVSGLGMLGGTNHQHLDVVFELVDGSEPEPPEPPSDEFQKAVMAALSSIYLMLREISGKMDRSYGPQ